VITASIPSPQNQANPIPKLLKGRFNIFFYLSEKRGDIYGFSVKKEHLHSMI